MPVIEIKSLESENKLDLHKMADEISIETGIELSRIQLTAEYRPTEDFLSGMQAIIFITASEGNGKDFFQALMKACVTSAAKQFRVKESRIAVIAHPKVAE